MKLKEFTSHICIDVRGNLLTSNVLAGVDDVAARSRQIKGKNLLLDVRGATMIPEKAGLALAGEHLALALTQFPRIALLVQPKHVTGIMEEAARGYGVNLRVFVDPDEATSWASASEPHREKYPS